MNYLLNSTVAAVAGRSPGTAGTAGTGSSVGAAVPVTTSTHYLQIIGSAMAGLSALTVCVLVVRWISKLRRKKHVDHTSEFVTFASIPAFVAAIGYLIHDPSVSTGPSTMCQVQASLIQFGTLGIVLWVAAGWHANYMRIKHYVTYDETGHTVVNEADVTGSPMVLAQELSLLEHLIAVPTTEDDDAINAGGPMYVSKTLRRQAKTEITYRLYHLVCWPVSVIGAVLPVVFVQVNTPSTWCTLNQGTLFSSLAWVFLIWFAGCMTGLVYFLKWRRIVDSHGGDKLSDDGVALRIVLFVSILFFGLQFARLMLVNFHGEVAWLDSLLQIAAPAEGFLFAAPALVAIVMIKSRRKALRELENISAPTAEEQAQYEQDIAEFTLRQRRIREYETKFRKPAFASEDRKAASKSLQTKAIIVVLYSLMTIARGSLGPLEAIAEARGSMLLLNAARSILAALFGLVIMLTARATACVARPWLPHSVSTFVDKQCVFRVQVRGDNGCRTMGRFMMLMTGMSVSNNQLPVTLIAVSAVLIPPTIIPVLLSTTPLLALFLKVLFRYNLNTITSTTVGGLIVSLAGSIFISVPQFTGTASGSNNALGVLLGMLSPLAFAFGAMYNKKYLGDYSQYQWTKALYANIGGGVVLALAAGLAHVSGLEHQYLLSDDWPYVAGLGVMAACSTIWMYTLMDLVDPVSFSTIWNMVPLVGVFIEIIENAGYLPSPVSQFAGVALIIASIVLLLQDAK